MSFAELHVCCNEDNNNYSCANRPSQKLQKVGFLTCSVDVIVVQMTPMNQIDASAGADIYTNPTLVALAIQVYRSIRLYRVPVSSSTQFTNQVQTVFLSTNLLSSSTELCTQYNDPQCFLRHTFHLFPLPVSEAPLKKFSNRAFLLRACSQGYRSNFTSR